MPNIHYINPVGYWFLSNGVKFYIFLISAVICFFLFTNDCNAQRAAGEGSVVNSIGQAAAPIVKEAYKRVEKRSGAVQVLSNAVGEAKPLIEKAIPIVQKGFKIGKKILKILKKILR